MAAAFATAAAVACRHPSALSHVQPRRVPLLRLAASRRAPYRPCSAGGSGDSEAGERLPGVPPELTLSEAYAILGLHEGSAYDEVLAAKNALLELHGGDFEMNMQVEAAYDLIFAKQLRARLTGDLPVASNVRFADVRRPAAHAAPASAAQKATQLLQGMPRGGIAVRPPAHRTATTAAAIFGVLAAWTLAQGLLEPSAEAAAVDVPGLQLALATGACVYLLREEKRVGLGKAMGLALTGLVAGTFVGAALQSWLRVDIIPLGSLASPGILVGEFSIIGLAAVCLFLT